jgi:hypothetical protein
MNKTTAVKKEVQKIDGFVGLYFHSFNEDGSLKYQGRVEYQLPDGRLICLMYEWLMGEPNNQDTFTIDQTLGWNFYTTREHWLFNCERLQQKQRAREQRL